MKLCISCACSAAAASARVSCSISTSVRLRFTLPFTSNILRPSSGSLAVPPACLLSRQ
ncbi:hypothetical protein PR003_g6792 [Phytophthora rubi]|uniref:Uncharacterized protein n=1 Tax=Phytophthora rubi TaxID=129364 RepID=A0A6A3MV34_9STRA|nr:hypothetical protein PR002_g6806 [Phytophthora rubi]KAE9038905.1 hypothetical protein PR001_g7757 [Phytophthora rubi]KAE9347703.1 hypothetical protein PR003_g6792 [Phytophthora rubi]